MKLAWLSTIPLLFIAFGLLKRRNRPLHMICMTIAFALDLALLLIVEFRRNAIQETLSSGGLNWLLNVHVAFSVVFLMIYLFQIKTGWAQWKLGIRSRFHANAAIVFVACRLGGFITSLFF